MGFLLVGFATVFCPEDFCRGLLSVGSFQESSFRKIFSTISCPEVFSHGFLSGGSLLLLAVSTFVNVFIVPSLARLVIPCWLLNIRWSGSYTHEGRYLPAQFLDPGGQQMAEIFRVGDNAPKPVTEAAK